MNQCLGMITGSAIWRVSHPTNDGPRSLILVPEAAPLPCDRTLPWYFYGAVRFDFEKDTRDSHEGGMKVVTREYVYSLRIGPHEEGEVITWHWHPAIADAAEPHVHVRALHEDVPGLRDLHIPTSRVFLEDVLIFAVQGLGVRCREGGLEELHKIRRRTRNWATWLT